MTTLWAKQEFFLKVGQDFRGENLSDDDFYRCKDKEAQMWGAQGSARVGVPSA